MVICGFALPDLPVKDNKNAARDDAETAISKLARIDFLGAAFLGSGVLALLLPLEIGGQKVPWNHPYIFVLTGVGLLLLGLFAATEAWLAREPIFPLRLFRNRDVVLTYIIYGAQCAAQVSVGGYFLSVSDHGSDARMRGADPSR